jgi:transposase
MKDILRRSDALTTTQRRVKDFVEILTGRPGNRLRTWMGDVETTGAPPLRSFAHGLGNDLDALTAGLTLDCSSGAVEGTVNPIKMIKRQIYGRAKFDLTTQTNPQPTMTNPGHIRSRMCARTRFR